MSKEQTFPLNPDQFGNKWLGKVVKFEQITAGEFDERRNASLAQRIGGDTDIMYLETEDVQNPEQGRATFFTMDTRPVAKWARFITSLKENCDIVLKSYDDLVGRILYFEEREEEMGKRGKQRVWEATGIPSPDEVAALGKAEAVAKAEAKPAPAAEPRSDDYISELILSTADGLTRDELSEELKAMGVDEPLEKIRELSNKLIAAGSMTFKDKKFSVS